MNEIKGRVICKIAEILSEMDTDNPDEGIKVIEKIVAIPEIAIVDREAGLPDISRFSDRYWEIFHPSTRFGAKEAQQDMLKAGWVKEVKEEKPFHFGCAEL